MQISVDANLRLFFTQHYVPRKLETPDGRNIEGYHRALDYWEALTDDPPLAVIDGNDALLSDFKAQLGQVCYACTSLPCLCGKQKTLSTNTIIKQLDHVQWVINEAGPRWGNNRSSAAGLISAPPWTRKPKRRLKYRPAIPLQAIAWVKHVADQATLPHNLQGCGAGDVWRALIEVMRSTSLRFGQCMDLPWACVDLSQRLMVLPEAVCRKSKQDEPHPVSSAAIGALLKLRGEGSPLVFGSLAKHSRTSVYKQLHRLQEYAGIEPFGFHDIRRAVLTEISQHSPAAAQLAAGHASYETTKRYQDVQQLMAIVETLPALDELLA